MGKYFAKHVAMELGIKPNTLTKRVKTFSDFKEKVKSYRKSDRETLLKFKKEKLFGRFRFSKNKGKIRNSFDWFTVREKD